MALHRSANMAEGIIIPEFYASEFGLIEMLDPCVRMTACSYGEIGGRGMLVPQFAVVWPLHTIPATLVLVQRHVLPLRGNSAVARPH